MSCQTSTQHTTKTEHFILVQTSLPLVTLFKSSISIRFNCCSKWSKTTFQIKHDHYIAWPIKECAALLDGYPNHRLSDSWSTSLQSIVILCTTLLSQIGSVQSSLPMHGISGIHIHTNGRIVLRQKTHTPPTGLDMCHIMLSRTATNCHHAMSAEECAVFSSHYVVTQVALHVKCPYEGDTIVGKENILSTGCDNSHSQSFQCHNKMVDLSVHCHWEPRNSI